jgi:hypothetical protein
VDVASDQALDRADELVFFLMFYVPGKMNGLIHRPRATHFKW